MINFFQRNFEPIGVSVAFIAIATIIIRSIDIAFGPEHLILGYLIPTSLIAFRYGSRPAMIGAIASTICAAFFLYAPIFSLYVTKSLDLAEMGLFLVLAIATTQFIAPISDRPRRNISR